MDKYHSGKHEQTSVPDPAMLALAMLAIERPVPGQSESAIMDFVGAAHESVWYQQVKAWQVERSAFVELKEVDDRVASLFDRGCQFIVDVVGWYYDEEDWWGLQKMVEEPLVNLGERIILASFTVEMRDHLMVDDPRLIGLEIFTEIVLRARWESYYRDMTSFLCQYYSDDLLFVQSLLDCDEKMQGLLKSVSEESGRSGP